MNKKLKGNLVELLHQEATFIMRKDEDIKNKIDEMDDIIKMQKIIEHFDELEPTLKKFFEEKAKDNKWNKGER
jgi:hypothetical protein